MTNEIIREYKTNAIYKGFKIEVRGTVYKQPILKTPSNSIHTRIEAIRKGEVILRSNFNAQLSDKDLKLEVEDFANKLNF